MLITMKPLQPDRLLPQYRIRTAFRRPSQETLQSLAGAATAPISDALRRRGCLPGSIRSISSPTPRIVGPAYTVQATPADQLLALYAIAHAQPGDVIVLAGTFTETGSAWGGIMSTMARKQGIAALVTDGYVRDAEQSNECGFPIFARGVRPLAPCKNVPPGDVNYPVAMGGTIIHPGDVIVADQDGIVVIPIDLADRVAPALEARKDKEDGWLARIAAEESVLFADGVRQTLDASETWIESNIDQPGQEEK